MQKSRLIVGLVSLVLLLATQVVVVVDPVEVPPPPPVVEPEPVVEVPKPTLVLYTHEKDKGTPPPGVMAALDEINRKHGVMANVFEVDTKNGAGEVPLQYRPAAKAASEAGLPCVVIMASEKLLKAIPSPSTKEQVIDEFARIANDH